MSEQPSRDHSVLVFMLGAFLFISPLIGWWSALELPWYAIFLPWGAIIALTAINARRSDS